MDTYLVVGVVVALIVVLAVVVGLRLRSSQPDIKPLDAPAASDTLAPPAPPERPTAEVGLKTRLARTRSAISGALGSMFGSGTSQDGWEELEDALILADVGPGASSGIVAAVKARSPQTSEEVAEALRDVLLEGFASKDRSLRVEGGPGTIIVVGVNGAGKTTTIAKLAHDLHAAGSSVVLGAADTFRAAGDTQLVAWGRRIGVEVVTGDQGADPASVAFKAVDQAKADGTDVVIIDTAGRLHADTNLMEELAKVARVVKREAGGISEILLVLDGSIGQNGIAQARAFTDAVGVTGVVLTKLDGTAKGGVAVAVEKELGLPIKYIGVGEGIEDLIPFEPREFVEALTVP